MIVVLLIGALSLPLQLDEDARAPATTEEPAAVSPAPATEESPPAAAGAALEAPMVEPGVPAEEACLALVREKKADEARACYMERAILSGEDGARARELAGLVASLRLTPPGDLEPPASQPNVSFGELLASGKAELVAASTLAGGYVAVLGTMGLLFSTGSSGQLAVGLGLLSPVIGGGLALVTSGLAVVLIPGISAGDAHVIRAFMTLGVFNSIILPFDLNAISQDRFGVLAGDFFLMAGTVGLVSGIGVLVAALTDMPEGAGSMAISGGLWSGVLAILIADMFQVYKLDARGAPLLITAAVNAGFLGALVGSTQFPMTRAETWAVDVGGGVGLLGGASLAFFARAPNPFLGWGSMVLGTTAGMAAGFVTARYVPAWLAAPVEGVSLGASPMFLPDPTDASGRAVVAGAGLVGRF
jgi:hypothetical protein